MPNEGSRVTAKKLVKLPSGATVACPCITQISFLDPVNRAQEAQYSVDNSPQSSRVAHVDELMSSQGAGPLAVERVDIWKVLDTVDRGQETQVTFDNVTGADSQPPSFTAHFKTHVVRYQNDPDDGNWIKSELIDEFHVLDPVDRGQETLFTLLNPNPAPDDAGDEIVTAPADAVDITDSLSGPGPDNPVRLDPFQNIVDFGGGGLFVIGSKGQQLGPADYYVSTDGRSWAAHIGALSVPGASFGDGNAAFFAGFGSNFIITANGEGFFAPAVQATEILASHDGGISFLSIGKTGYSSAGTGVTFNYYDQMPGSGGHAGFRLSVNNQALTTTTYYSSYDDGNTWVNEGTSKPSFWGPVPINTYAKGVYQGNTFYVASITGSPANGDIYGGTTVPPNTNTIPSGWVKLFSNNLSVGFAMAANIPGQADTQFVMVGGGNTTPAAAAGTGDPSTWHGALLPGQLQIIHGVSSDSTTWVYP